MGKVLNVDPAAEAELRAKCERRTQILGLVKEVREELDATEAARLVQTGDWIITLAAIQPSGDILWVLMRIC